MIAAKEKIVGIVETKRGNKFDRTESWEERHDYVFNGQYIGNCHTGVYHVLGCGDIDKMNNEHKVPTDNEKGLYRGCGHCRPALAKFGALDNFRISRDDAENIEICYDPKVARIFEGVDCDCGAPDGMIKMRPHSGGVRLLNHEGEKFWIWRECYSCGHQLSLDKAMKERGEI